ncbi:MAG: CCA tRNA nucleotidyltransferase [Fimbriiglobus sp.]
MTERDFATNTVRKLQMEGFIAYWAGGCVRDELLGLTPADYDIATNATPSEVQKIFHRSHSFGASFGVVEVLGPRDAAGEWLKVQVATFRTDGHYSDGRRPDSVTYSSPQEDAERRDFTINGMFMDPLTGQVMDYVGGRSDLIERVLRAIGDPVARFTEDKLRILRAVRMAARFELTIETRTFDAIQAMAHEIHSVSAERITEEYRKILKHPRRVFGVELLLLSGLWKEIFAGFDPNPTSRLTILAALPDSCTFEVVFVVLMPEFNEAFTHRDWEAFAKCHRLSNEEISRITWLNENAMILCQAPHLPKSVLKPILAHPGCTELLTILEACGFKECVSFCWDYLFRTPRELLEPPPLVTGEDLIRFGWKPGVMFKQVLGAYRLRQLEDESLTRELVLRELAEHPPV